MNLLLFLTAALLAASTLAQAQTLAYPESRKADDRVVPSHSYKYTAALQAAQGCARPVLIRVEPKASHGYRPTDRQIAEIADQWAFAAEQMRMSAPAGMPVKSSH